MPPLRSVPLLLAGLALLAVSGCAAEVAPIPTNTGPTPTHSVEPSPSPTQAQEPTSFPVTISCDELVTPQVVYDYNPNYGTDPDYEPVAGGVAERIVELDGVACGWVNQTSGETIEIAVANLADVDLENLKNTLVVESNSVPTYEVEGYFKVSGGTGEANAFSGSFWIFGNSTSFFEPGDAEPLVRAAITALG